MKPVSRVGFVLIILILSFLFVFTSCTTDEEELTVAFMVDNEVYKTETITKGGSVTPPEVPEKTGYIGSWDIKVFSNILENMIVTAKYTPRDYSIVFKAEDDEGVLRVIETRTAPYEGSLTNIPEVPEREGFSGEWSVNNFSYISSDMEVLANYTRNTYTIEFYTNGGEPIDTAVLEYRSDFDYIPQREGYIFEGWYKDEQLNETFDLDYVPSEDLNLYAKWSQILHTVYLETQDDNLDSTITRAYGISVDSLPTLARTGYKFNNWYFDDDFTQPVELPLYLEEDITIYADWILDNRNVATDFSYFVFDYETGAISANTEKVLPEDIIIPSIYDGNVVNAIADNAFSDTSIKTVEIPESITDIGDFAFNLDTLQTIDFSSTSRLRTIGNGAFMGSAITQIIFPEKLQSIGHRAFYNCLALDDIIYINADNLVTIGGEAYKNTLWYDNYTDGAEGSVVYIGKVLYSAVGSLATEIVLRANTISISSQAFQHQQNFNNFNIPDSVQYIGGEYSYDDIDIKGAFYNCFNLTYVNFNSTSQIKSIGKGAFAGCTSIVSLAINTDIALPEIFSTVETTDSYAVEYNQTTYYIPLSLKEIKVFANGENEVLPYAFANLQAESITLAEGIEGIGDYAFYNSVNIEEFNLPNSILTIGEYAFKNCEGLSQINLNLQNNLTTIEEGAFYGLSETIFNFNNTDKLQTVGSYAFYGCENFNDFIAPQILQIGEGAFAGCRGLQTLYIPNNLNSVYGLFAQDSELPTGFYDISSYSVPSSLNEITIVLPEDAGTVLADEYLMGFLVEVINLPNLTAIGENALSGTEILSIDLPDSLQTISSYALSQNKKLRNINISSQSSISVIGSYAFAGCSLLEGLFIPQTTESFDLTAIESCNNLKNIIVDDLNEVYFDDNGVFYNQDTLLSYPKDRTQATYRVAEGTKYIENNAFSDTMLLHIELPESLVQADASAFDNINLDTVTMYANNIIDNIFSDTAIIDELIIVGESIVENYAVNSKMLKVTISEGVTEIGEYAFQEGLLSEVYIPESLTVIKAGAFDSCLALETITFENAYTLTEVGMDAFIDTLWYQNQAENTILYIGNIAYGYVGDIQDTSLVIKDGITVIADAAFKDLNISQITLPSSLQEIGEHAFANLNNLREITFNENLITISQGAFSNNQSLETVVFSSTIEYIGDNAFSGNQNLNSIILPQNLKYIGEQAFSDNTALSSILIPEGVEFIGEKAFYGATSLNSIAFENIDSLKDMGRDVFDNTLWYNSASNGEIMIPGTNVLYKYKGEVTSQYFLNADVTRILPYAFSAQNNLTALRLNEDLQSIGKYAFENCINLTRVFNVSVNMALNHIGEGAFSSCESLTTFTIPKELTELDLSIFENCYNLSIIIIDDEQNNPNFKVSGGIIYNSDFTKLIYVPMGIAGSIDLEDTITEIPDYAFKDRNQITSIFIHKQIESIGKGAFENTDLLTNIEFETNSSLQSIEEKTFFNQAITSITLPKRVQFIGEDAFNYAFGINIFFMSDTPPQIEGEIDENSNLFVPRNRINIYRENIDFANIFPSRVRVSFMDGLYLYRYYEVAYGESISSIPNTPQIEGYEVNWSDLNSVWNETSSEFIPLYEDVIINTVYTKKSYTITFYNKQESYEQSYLFKDSLTNIVSPESDGDMFLFWTKDINTLQEFALNKMPAQDIELYAVWYEFEYELDTENEEYSVKPAITNLITPQTVIIPDEYNQKPVVKIANNAFENNEDITIINIPDSIRKIGDYAFANSSLENIVLGENSNLAKIGEYAFSYSGIENFLIDNELTILEKAFYNAEKLIDVNISLNFSQSGDHLFQNAINLQTAVISTTESGTIAGVEAMFKNCYNLKEVILPQNMNTIEKDTFANCYELEIIDLTNISYIENSAFEQCSSLEQLEFNNIITVSQYAFSDCENLKNIDFGDSPLVTIGDFAFSGCNQLSHLVFPATTKNIEEGAFSNTNIDSVYVMENPQEPLHGSMNLIISTNALPSNTLIYVGADLDYNQNKWQDYTALLYRDIFDDFVVDIDNIIIKYIGTDAIVEIPERIGTDFITGIDDNIFENNTTIEQITLTESLLQVIDNGRIFAGAENLNYINSPNSVNGVLYNQDNSMIMAYPQNKDNTIFQAEENVTSFADYAFAGVKNLNSLIINNEIPPQIGENTFENINSNMKIYVPSSALDVYKNADIWQSYADIIYPEMIGYNDFVFVEHSKGLELSQYHGNADTIDIPLALNGYNVVSIGDYAFYNTAITTINMPSSIKYIGDYAFANCNNLNNITLHNGIMTLGRGAFENCSSLNQIEISSRILLQEIKAYAFKNTSLSAINIPRNVTTIGDGAFENNSNLQTVTIATGSNLLSIGDRAFYNNQKLNYFNLSSAQQLISIGERAFAYCSQLASIYIPQTVTTLSSYAFAYCENLTSFNFIGSSSLNSFGDHVFYGSTAIERLNIPASVITIGERAFYNNNFSKVNFAVGSQLSVIGEDAFAMSNNLKSVHLYENVVDIRRGAFSDCLNLRWLIIESELPPVLHNTTTKVWEDNLRIYVPKNSLNQYKSAWQNYSEGINSYDMIYDEYSIIEINGGVEIFQYMGEDEAITVPEKINEMDVLSIGSFAFGKESYSVTLPDSVTSIKSMAFYRSNISSFNIGENITEIEDNPFVDTYLLEEIVVDQNNEYFAAVDNVLFDKDISKLIAYPNAYSLNSYIYEIPSTVDTIGVAAFRGSISLSEVTIPQSVTYIGDFAFYGDTSLSEVIFDDALNLDYVGQNAFYNTLWYDNQDDGVIYITSSINGDQVAYTYKGDMPEDTQITIDESALSILPRAFENRDNLTALHIPYGVLKIGDNILSGCSQIYEITVSGNYILGHLFGEIEFIGSYSSYNYKTDTTYYIPYSLETVNIADMSYEITSHMLYNIKSVTDINIPNTVEYIGRFAFYSPDGDMMLENINFEDLELSQLKTIGSYSFKDCEQITTLSLPDDLKTINSYAFSGLNNLTTIIIDTDQSQLEYIGVSAFADCDSLAQLDLPLSIKYIANKAFINCSSIYSINIPRQALLSEIGASAFKNNRNLRSFVTTNNLKKIHDEAFYDCISLNTFEYTFSIESLIYMGSDIFTNSPYYNMIKSENTNTLIYFGRVAYEYNGLLSDGTLLTLKTNTYSVSPNLFNGEDYNIAKVTTVAPEEHPQTVVVLNMTLQMIGRYAFANNDNLTEVILPPDLQYIGDYAFTGCSRLGNVTFEDETNLEYLGNNVFEGTGWYSNYYANYQNDAVVYIGDVAYSYKGQSEEVFDIRLFEDTVSVSPFAFDSCYNLLTIHFPSSINEITQFAFGSDLQSNDEKSLSTIYIENAIDIENMAGIFALSSKVIINSQPAELKGSVLYSYEMEDEGETITVYEFMNIFELIQIYIEEGIMPDIYAPKEYLSLYYDADGWSEIYDYIIPYDTIYEDFVVKFDGDEAEIIYYKGDNSEIVIPSMIEDKLVTSIGSHAFNTSISSVTMGDNIEKIGDYAFYRNTSLQTVVFSDSVVSIGDYAFAYCNSIEDIVMPQNMNAIGDYAFYACENMETIELNEGLKNIGKYALAKCTTIIHLTIPSSVEYMGNYVFNDCDLLNIIVMLSDTPPLLDKNGLYYQTMSDAQIFVNSTAVNTYKSNTHWTKYTFRIHSVEDIADLLIDEGVYTAGGDAELSKTLGDLFEVYIAPMGITDRTLLHTEYEQGDDYYNRVTKLEGDRLNTIIDLPQGLGQYTLYVVKGDDIISTGENILSLQ